jgi:hypothetical protein
MHPAFLVVGTDRRAIRQVDMPRFRAISAKNERQRTENAEFRAVEVKLNR